MNDIWLILFVSLAGLFLALTILIFIAIILGFGNGDFEPIEPKGKVERKENKNKD